MTRDERPWELLDPAATITEILEQSGAALDQTVVAHVDIATQRVTGTRTVTTPRPVRYEGSDEGEHARHRLSEQVREIAEDLGRQRQRNLDRPGWEVPDSVLITLVCRTGRVVTTAREMQWARAWLYSNHFMSSFNGEVYIVTPDGWAASSGQSYGVSPRVGVTPRPALRAV